MNKQDERTKMKSIRINFRLSHYQLARGLQVMKQLEPTYQLTSINDMVKTIYHDYLAKMTLNKTSAVPTSFLAEINSFINTSNQKLTIENLFSAGQADQANQSYESPAEPDEPEEDFYNPNEKLSDETLAEIEQLVNQNKRFASIVKASDFVDPNETESEISTITDFSPPKDWMA
jgi:hypothetical protein